MIKHILPNISGNPKSLKKYHTSWKVPEAVTQRCSVRKVFLEIPQNSQENTCARAKKRLWHRCFPVNFAKFLRTPFLWKTPGLLLLKFFKYSNVYNVGEDLLRAFCKLLYLRFCVSSDQ